VTRSTGAWKCCSKRDFRISMDMGSRRAVFDKSIKQTVF
jgi:hypothetical protein